MKKYTAIFTILALLVTLFIPITAAAAGNLIKNAGFEEDNNSNPEWPYMHWQVTGENSLSETTNPNIKTVNSPANARTGSYYLMNNNFNVLNNCWQYFSAQTTASHTISGYIKTNITAKNSGALTRITILKYDWSTEITSWWLYADDSFNFAGNNGNTWHKFSFDLNLTAGEYYVINISNNTIGDVESWGYPIPTADKSSDVFFAYDDLSVMVTGTEPPEPEPEPDPDLEYDLQAAMPKNVIKNGDFSDDFTHWTDWTPTIFGIGSGADSDKYAIFNSPGLGEWHGIAQTIEVRPYTEYEISYDIKVNSSTLDWGIFCKVAVSSTEELTETFFPDLNIKNSWQKLTASFSSQNHSSLVFYIGGCEAAYEFDNVSVRARATGGITTSINENRDAIVGSEPYLLNGNLSQPADLSITLNGSIVTGQTTGDDNEFSIPLELLEGENTISVLPVKSGVSASPVNFKLYKQKIKLENVVIPENITSGMNLSCSYDIKNLTTDPIIGIAVLCLYSDSGIMQFVSCEDIALNPGQEKSLSIGTTALTLNGITNPTAKIYFLKSFANPIPYATN